MWFQFTRTLRCPLCAGSLALAIFDETRVAIDDAHAEAARWRGLLDADFTRYVDAGAQPAQDAESSTRS